MAKRPRKLTPRESATKHETLMNKIRRGKVERAAANRAFEKQQKIDKTKGSGSRSTTKFAYPRGGGGGISTGGRGASYPYKK